MEWAMELQLSSSDWPRNRKGVGSSLSFHWTAIYHPRDTFITHAPVLSLLYPRRYSDFVQESIFGRTVNRSYLRQIGVDFGSIA